MVHSATIRIWVSATALATALAVMCGMSLVPETAHAQQQNCTSNDDTAPCFAQNPDILGGQRYLLRNDDLVVNFPTVDATAPSTTVDNYLLYTMDVTTASPIKDSVVKANCAARPPETILSQARVGRVYALPNDVIATLAPRSECAPLAIYIRDPQDSSHDSITGFYSGSLSWPQFALGDFNQDGFQDIFYIDGLGSLTTFTGADNLNDPSAGLHQGPMAGFDSTPELTPLGAPVVGDFNGDGVLDVAWPGGNPVTGGALKVYFASVCPAADVEVLGQTCDAAFQILLSSQTIDTGLTLILDSSNNTLIPQAALAADDFDGEVNPTNGRAPAELLVAIQTTATTTVGVYSFDSELTPTAGPNTLVYGPHPFPFSVLPTIASGRLDWSSRQAQAVIAIAPTQDDDQARVSVITFSTDLTMTRHDLTDGLDEKAIFKRQAGVAIGRFDPADPSEGTTDFNQQIAVLYDILDNDQTTSHAAVRLYTVNPPTSFTPVWKWTTDINGPIDGVLVAPLQVGDLQGRSLQLGAPEKTTVAHTQPDTVLGLPPMHVDFIVPPGKTEAEVLNVTVFPDSFNTAYSFQTTTGTQASRQSSTSYTASTKESAEAKVSYGVPDVDSVSVQVKTSATQTHMSTVANTYNTYSGQTYTFTTATVFDDKVAATSEMMNIYSYPVIGQTVCPAAKPNCTDSERVPLYIQYSAPDNIWHIDAANAAGLEWFQPPNEPGNLFSYPGSFTLLKAGGPQQLALLTPSNEEWASTSMESFSVDWSHGGGNAVSSGSVSTHSFDTSVTVSGEASFEGGGVSGSASVDYNQSTSVSTLNTATQTFGESTGVTLNRVEKENSNFLYAGQSYIFGQDKPSGTIQTDLTLSMDVQVQSEGYLQVGHSADPLTTTTSGVIQSGDWWKQAYTAAPDVALHHPERWSQKLIDSTQQVQFNCPIGYTSAFGTPPDDPGSCTSTNTTPTPDNVSDALFYQMKGLFVTPGTSLGGPTTTMATLGDTVTLQARVYNYSLMNMSDDTTVHVRFYAQPWDSTQGQFAAGSGKYGFADSVFIDEVQLPPTPAFCGGSQGDNYDPCTDENAPLNWVLAQTSWDTSTLSPQPSSDTTWKFWVVVWMEDSAGLVPEIAQHGLTSIPAQNVASLAEIPVETYSNNLGFYNQVFQLALPTTTPPAPTTEEPSLAIEAVEVSPVVVLRDQPAVVRAQHLASGRQFDHVRAFLYGGDPQAGGELLDMDIIPRVSTTAPFVVPFRYRPRVCGPQTLFMQAVPVGAGGLVEAAIDVFVTLDPIAQTRLLIEQVESLGLEVGTEQSLLAKLEAAERSFQRGNQVAGLNQLDAFAHELSAQSGKAVPEAKATQMIAQVTDLESCL
jgi:hypothetical protein